MTTNSERDPRVDPRPGDCVRDGIGLVHDVVATHAAVTSDVVPDVAVVNTRVYGNKGGEPAVEWRRSTLSDWRARMRGATIEKRGDQ